jgi:NitT/TauT family transport system permease protein
LIFGLGETSKIFMLSAGVFFPVLINTITGALSVPTIYLDLGNDFGARGLRFYRTVVIPAALPVIFAGFKNGINIALVLIVIAEIAGAKSGVGYMIWSASLTYDIEVLYAGLLIIAAFGILVNHRMDAVQNLLIS